MRIRQEMILGIGGLRALKAVGINPTVCHMNEGHAAFMSIERIRQYMVENKCDFRTARQVIVSGNVFTTHTPVLPAGLRSISSGSWWSGIWARRSVRPGLPFAEFPSSLGQAPWTLENQGESFNMAILAMENANHVNGVSKLHAEVTREMFSSRWPGYPESEVPVTAITNGIHTLTWVGKDMANLFDEHISDSNGAPQSRRDQRVWANVESIPDEELWAVLENQRGQLVRFIRRRLQQDLERRTSVRPEFGLVGNSILDPRILTIGFARRFATYKRGTLMITDKERLNNILFHPERPVQIVISGKSHPRDDGGKKLIQELVNYIGHDGPRSRMVFLEDYDMNVARHLVQGVDVWLNNPRRPYEASGTSGMKVVPNGGLNCSILDGWWDEGYEPGLGWAIGDRSEVSDEGHQDWLDSRSLYHLIENEISPVYYHRVDNGIPRGWLQMVKKSIMRHAPEFSTNRMVRDYATESYVTSHHAYMRLSGDHQVKAKAALEWRARQSPRQLGPGPDRLCQGQRQVVQRARQGNRTSDGRRAWIAHRSGCPRSGGRRQGGPESRTHTKPGSRPGICGHRGRQVCVRSERGVRLRRPPGLQHPRRPVSRRRVDSKRTEFGHLGVVTYP